MKKLIIAVLGSLSLLSASPARADAWTCQLQGDVSGFRLGLGISGQVLGGDGWINCVKEEHGLITETREDIPVELALIGGGVGFDFNYVRRVHLVTGALGEVRNPYDLTGQFSVGASAGATLIKRGISANSAISVKHRANGIGFEIGLMGEKAYGLGARVHGTVLIVKPRHD